MVAGRNFPSDFTAEAGSSFGGLAVDRKGRLKLSPENDLDANEVIVQNGDTVDVDGTDVTLSVSSGAITGGSIPATAVIVNSGDAIEVGGSTYTFTVAGGEVTAIVVA